MLGDGEEDVLMGDMGAALPSSPQTAHSIASALGQLFPEAVNGLDSQLLKHGVLLCKTIPSVAGEIQEGVNEA